MRFSQPPIKIEVYLCVCTFLSWIILWIFCPSVCLSGYKRHKCIKIETSISQLLFKIEVWFFCKDSSDRWSSILWISSPSVCRVGYKRDKYEKSLFNSYFPHSRTERLILGRRTKHHRINCLKAFNFYPIFNLSFG